MQSDLKRKSDGNETMLVWWSCKNDLFSKNEYAVGVENDVLKGGVRLFTVS